MPPRTGPLTLLALLVAFAAPAAAQAAPTIWTVGDGAAAGPTDDEVGAMIGAQQFEYFLYLGDVYDDGTLAEFYTHYEGAYGAYKSISRPTPGNHEWPNHASGYDLYWPAAYTNPHYYSFDVGDWHVISLNSEESSAPGSAQLNWLQADLAAHPGTCTIAYWHRPRYAAESVINAKGDTIGGTAATAGLWNAVVGRAAIVLNGHVHNYQRRFFGPDTTAFVVGSGGEGAEHHTFLSDPPPNLDAYDDSHFGALKLVLSHGSAAFGFEVLGGQTLDAGTIPCKTTPTATTDPAADITASSVTLQGTVNPHGLATAYRFEYGPTPAYGSQTPEVTLAPASTDQPVRVSLAGLDPATKYHYRLVAANSLGATSGADREFQTAPVAPEILATVPQSPANDSSPEVQGTAAPASTVRIYSGPDCTGDPLGEGSSEQFAASGITVIVARDALTELRATASDSVGTSSPCSAAFAFVEDSTAPETLITSRPPNHTHRRQVKYRFSADDPAASFECALDKRQFASCDSPVAYRVRPGRHRLRIRARDEAGNVDPTPARDLFRRRR